MTVRAISQLGACRRRLLRAGLAACTAGALAAPSLLRAQERRTTLRMLLNTSYSSPQAWLLLAQANGHLAREGVELQLAEGAGAYTAAPRMVEGAFDLAYGDVNSLIEVCSRNPKAAPVGVYMMFNASPSCILVSAEGPFRHPSHLSGQHLVGHASDVALRTFGALGRHLHLDTSRVAITHAWSGMSGMAEDVLAGRAAGAFGYVSTFCGALTAADPSLLRRVRFLRYADLVPDPYGSVVMASQRLLRDEPELVTRVVRALNRGVVDMLQNPEAGLDAVARLVPGLNRDAERVRLQATLDLEMNPALPAGSSPTALGDADLARLERSIALMVAGNALPRVPSVQEIFTRAHLPTGAERARPKQA
jgi:NitT/TauT family transport system substrate-binding protein